MFETTRRKLAQLEAERDYWRDHHDVDRRLRALRRMLGASDVTVSLDENQAWTVRATRDGDERQLVHASHRQGVAGPLSACEALDWAIEQVQQAMAAAAFPEASA